MVKHSNILYYSINTELAYFINKTYYRKHFIWCSPIFDSLSLDKLSIFSKIPPSSSPLAIYSRFKEDVVRDDLHSTYISQNRAGLKKGAIQMLNDGVIDTSDFARIIGIIDQATIQQFSPLIYLIPKGFVETNIKLVDVDSSANPLSIEYQISDLTEGLFEVIQL